MNKQATTTHGAGDRCLARSVADLIVAEPTLEAVTLNPLEGSGALASFSGKANPRIQASLLEAVLAAQDAAAGCPLAKNEGSCAESPQSPSLGRRTAFTRRVSGRPESARRKTCTSAN